MDAGLFALSHMPPHTLSGSELFKKIAESLCLVLKHSPMKRKAGSCACTNACPEAENSLPGI